MSNTAEKLPPEPDVDGEIAAAQAAVTEAEAEVERSTEHERKAVAAREQHAKAAERLRQAEGAKRRAQERIEFDKLRADLQRKPISHDAFLLASKALEFKRAFAEHSVKFLLRRGEDSRIRARLQELARTLGQPEIYVEARVDQLVDEINRTIAKRNAHDVEHGALHMDLHPPGKTSTFTLLLQGEVPLYPNSKKR
jgi:hypothetical protein